jgi:hypothetical protein
MRWPMPAGRPKPPRNFSRQPKQLQRRRALELRQRAGAQLLMGGHIEKGSQSIELCSKRLD